MDDLSKDCRSELAAVNEYISRLEARIAELEAAEDWRQSALFERMWEKAMAGDKMMLVWLSRQMLDGRDIPASVLRKAG